MITQKSITPFKVLAITFLALNSIYAFADRSDHWKGYLRCYGTFFSDTKFNVHINHAKNDEGTSREVWFGKEPSNMDLITETCSVENDFLICESKKVTVKVDISGTYSNGGLWDAAQYLYYPTEVSRTNFWGTRTEEIRCRI